MTPSTPKLVGANVGAFDGLLVVGAFDGLLVGANVGAFDGLLVVGAFDGLLVGANVKPLMDCLLWEPSMDYWSEQM